ncbi:MAG: PKD domain-containing protein, partial [Flavobacteriales bacterium]|nr:PKD domain-containing protein [Flavobacteriales bacterium]
MNRTPLFKAGILKFLVFYLIFVPGFAWGQYCTPNADCSDGDQIENFIFNTISNLNSGGSNCFSNGYINTGMSTAVTVGSKYAIGMQAGTAWGQGFGVWIDYNQDNDFNDADEFIYASPSAGLNWFNDSIIISSLAVSGATRLRVRSQFGQTINATESCSAFTWGETEDYTVNIAPNSVPPIANFTADTIFTCSGLINFTDLSTNAPTSWSWDFGDGNFSTVQNPSYIYLADGTYNVQLNVTNGFGTDSIAFISYITVSLNGPIAPSCTPITFGHCCQMGIYNVQFSSINNNSGNGSLSYEDFSCGAVTNLTMNLSYAISVETGPTFEENVAVWIDYNNDGIFGGGEQVFTSLQVLGVHTGTVTIPGNPVANTSLRMRVGSDWYQNPTLLPCVDVQYGQFEDYTVMIQPDTIPPIANFIADATLTCNGLINFTDLSSISPTSWFWDFGDGFTDTVQNPSHTYSIDGAYSVTLIATNQYGSDTVVFTNYIQVNVSGGGPIVASCAPTTLNYCCGFGITQLNFNTISSTTVDGSAGYEDLTCTFGTNVVEGQSYSFFADMSAAAPGKHNIRVWIDYNNDGVLNDISELAYSDDNILTSSGSITIASGGVLNTALRMRVSADYDFEAVPTPCNDQERGQTEDYSITILPNTNPPVAGFTTLSTMSCDGAVSFIDESGMVPTFWLWDFGDGQTSNLQNPVHTYLADSVYTVTLIVANSNGSDTLTMVNFITVALGTGPVTPSCTPSTLQYCCGYGTYGVTFAGISNTTGGGVDDYQDFSCTQQAYVIAGQSYGLSILTGISNPQDTRAWIDYDNDGLLDDLTERVFTVDAAYNPSALITIPTTAVQDTALRLRISSDFSGSTPTPCWDPWYGQVEDYAILVGLPPNASFTASDSSFCESTCISFSDLSSNNPTSWTWNFP